MLFIDGSDVAGFVQLPAGARIVQVSEQVSIMPSGNLPSRLLKNSVRSRCERKLSVGARLGWHLGGKRRKRVAGPTSRRCDAAQRSISPHPLGT